MTFEECVAMCATDMELVDLFDNLKGTNLMQRGTTIDVMADQASGRYDSDVRIFIDFVRECIWERVDLK